MPTDLVTPTGYDAVASAKLALIRKIIELPENTPEWRFIEIIDFIDYLRPSTSGVRDLAVVVQALKREIDSARQRLDQMEVRLTRVEQRMAEKSIAAAGKVANAADVG